MSIWLHILIAALIPTSILIGGSVFFLVTGQLHLALLLPIPLAVVALVFFMKLVPARCPDCGGKAYLKRSMEKKFFYECLSCGPLEKTDCTLDE